MRAGGDRNKLGPACQPVANALVFWVGFFDYKQQNEVNQLIQVTYSRTRDWKYMGKLRELAEKRNAQALVKDSR